MIDDSINHEKSFSLQESAELGPNGFSFFSGAAPFVFMFLLGLVGAFASGFLSYRHILLVSQAGVAAESFLCRPSEKVNCDAILQSSYSVLFDFLPSSVLGLMGFALLLWFSFNGWTNSPVRKEAWACILVYLSVAIVFSCYYACIMVSVMDVLCPWCVVVHVLNFLGLIFAWGLAIKKRRRFELPATSSVGERSYLLLGGVMVTALVFFVAGFLEKTWSLDNTKKKYDGLSDNPLVVAALLRESPDYEIKIGLADPVYGDVAAPYPIIFFSDFECPVCLRKEIFLRAVVDINSKYLRLVFKNYPLSNACNARIVNNLHPIACKAAQAAYAAFILGGPNLFWNFGDLLFAHQGQLNSRVWSALVAQAGLQATEFQALMEPDSAAEKKVREDVELGVNLGLDSTPEVFFERKKLPTNLRGEHFVLALETLIRSNHPDQKDLLLIK